jgi:flagellar motility protein MotE (MotC chaperone)
MNKNAKIALYAGGGLFGFGLAYIAFALALGVQPHSIPVAGKVFPAPPEQAQQKGSANTPATVSTSEPEQRREPARAGLLDVFQIESPFSAKELEVLVAEIKRKSKELDQRLIDLAERERRAAERAEFLDEQYAELQRLRGGLEQWEDELELRQGEVQNAESVQAERREQSWATLGKLFADGDAAEQGRRLTQYSPADAARILQTLKPARAKELLDNVGTDKWKEYAEALRNAEPPKQD